ncbi:hypothetical protein EBS02_06195, partial [bacterium]|nr:hypothetical protein [bacterium]
PGATRFYRTEKGLASQEVVAKVCQNARLEWLPLETIAYNNCQGLNKVCFDLDAGGELIAWDITALGLPTASLPFEQGQLQQHMEIAGWTYFMLLISIVSLCGFLYLLAIYRDIKYIYQRVAY